MSSEGPYARQPATGGNQIGTTNDGGVLPVPIPFGKYYLLEKVATGGMAEIFKAKAFGVEGFERLLAVKKILPTISEDTEFISMFIDEAKIAGRLNHANIAQIFDLGKADGAYFIALEYVSGQNARAVFERCRRVGIKLGIDMACYSVMKVCEGLDYAHNKTDSLGNPLNIVHRDVSPQNVLLSYEGEVKIIDFGIAKAAGKSTQTQVGILKGKFSYMSPEQVRGLTLDRRSDIFSLSIVLYELLTLERLFLGESDFETLEKIRKVDVASPTLHNPHIPAELEDIVMKGLAKDPNKRFQSTAEMQEALQKFMFNSPIYFTAKDLAASMQSMFAEEIRQERRKLEYYQTLDLDTIRIQAGEVEPPAVMRGSGSDLDWDEDEIATTVYTDGPEDEIDLGSVIDDLQSGDDWAALNTSDDTGTAINLDDDSALIEIEDEEDAWDRLIAHEPPKVERSPTPPPVSVAARPAPVRPSGIYPVKRRRSTFGLVALLVIMALVLGAGVVYFISTLRQGIEMVFTPRPEQVRILIDDVEIHDGSTPFTYEDAEPGTYLLTIVADEHEAMTQTVTLHPGGRYNINWSLNPAPSPPAGVHVTSTPVGAAIWVDGADTGRRTPGDLVGLEQGPHTIRLVSENFVSLEREFIVGTEPISLEEELVAAQYRLQIQARPEAASYILSDQETGLEVQSGSTPADLPTLDGSKTYLLIVHAPDHLRFTELLNPSSQLERTVLAQLAPIGGRRTPDDGSRPPDGDTGSAEATASFEEIEREAYRQRAREREEARARAREEAREEARQAARERDRERDREAEREAEREREREAEREAEQAAVVEAETETEQDIEPGTLSVQSRPAARVFIDGEEIGYTPIRNHELPPGRYTIRLVNEEFGLEHEQRVDIRSGNPSTVIHRQD